MAARAPQDGAGGPRTGTVLVAYATAHGSTREVAERIATRLRAAGLTVDVGDVDTQSSVTPYDAVVLGSAVQGAAWLPQAVQFAQRHQQELRSRPVWLFSVGLHPAAARQSGVFRRLISTARPQDVPALTLSLAPVQHRSFAGAIRRGATSGAERGLLRLLGGRLGDFRQWPDIDAWADGIARTVTAADAQDQG